MARDFKSLAGLGAASAISAMLTILFVAISGRKLGPSEYSDFAAAMSMIQLLVVVAGPIGPAAARLVARFRARGEEENIAGLRHSIATIALRAIPLIAIAGAIATIPLASFMHLRSAFTPLLALAAVVAVTLLSIDRGIVQGLGAWHRHNANVLLEPVLRLTIGLALFAVSHSAVAALLAYAVAPFVAELHLAWTFRRDWRGTIAATIPIGALNETLLPLAVAMGTFACFQNVDVLAAKRFLAPADAGLYGAAVSLTRAFSVTFFPVYAVAGPMLTEIHETGKRITGATLKLCAAFLGLSAVPLILMVAAPRPIVVLVFGAAYERSAPLLAAVAPLSVLTWLSLMVAQGLVTLGNRAFVKVWIAVAILQGVALAMFHARAMQIVATMYAVQLPLSIVTVLLLVRADRQTRDSERAIIG